jgi:hypothetical protein
MGKQFGIVKNVAGQYSSIMIAWGANMKRILPRKRLSFTQACKVWDKERKAFRERKFEIVDGVEYPYPCAKRGHTHNIDCVTPEMWDAACDIAYAHA